MAGFTPLDCRVVPILNIVNIELFSNVHLLLLALELTRPLSRNSGLSPTQKKKQIFHSFIMLASRHLANRNVDNYLGHF